MIRHGIPYVWAWPNHLSLWVESDFVVLIKGLNGYGGRHQMCIIHEKRIPKKALKYDNPKGDVKTFLEQCSRLYSRYMDAHDIEDPHARQVAATCLDRAMSDLIHDNWQDDDNGTINSYIKRWRREGYHMPTFLGLNGIDPDNNRVERTNRMFVCMIP